MFTIDNRRNRNAAIITVAAASFIVCSSGFAASKRDVGRGHSRQDASFEVNLIHPGTPPSSSGDHDITVGAMRNRDLNISPEPGTLGGRLVTITTPSPFPTGRGHDITAGAMRNRDLNISPEPGTLDGTLVTITTPSPFPTGNDHGTTAGGLRKRDRKVTPEPGTLGGTLVTITTPSPFPMGRGHDITAGAMRNRDLNISHEPGTLDGTLVTITTPSPFPTGNDHGTTAGGLRKRDRKVTPQTEFFIVTLRTPSPLGSSHGNDFSAGALVASGDGSVRTTSPASGRSFIQSLDMTSSVRYVGGTTLMAPARNPFADGRAWVSLDREGQNGLVATAGWSFLLK